jgi:putative hemolysin
MTKKIILVIVGVAVVAALAVYVVKTGKTNVPGQNIVPNDTDNSAVVPGAASNTTEAPAVGLANPASVNCKDKGGNLVMQKQPGGGEYGVCFFEDNRQCEEWALFRGDCPVGGKKITGYDNDAEIYCAITGGVVQGVGTETPMCKRIDGTLCTAQANFEGKCPDPNDPNPSAGNVETP